MTSEKQAMKIVNRITSSIQDWLPSDQHRDFSIWRKNNNDELFDYVQKELKSYALQIAQEAVEEEKNQIRAEGFVEGSARNSAYVALLTRIKKLTEES